MYGDEGSGFKTSSVNTLFYCFFIFIYFIRMKSLYNINKLDKFNEILDFDRDFCIIKFENETTNRIILIKNSI